MMIYRIARKEFCGLGGEGAKKYGGRWNLPGYSALYGAGSVASALLERLTIDPELFSSDRYVLYVTLAIDCPDDLIVHYPSNDLPIGWDEVPSGHISQDFGTALLKSGKLCFGVPSVVDRTSMNFVLNPDSPDFEQIRVEVAPLKLDHRLVQG